MVDIQCYIGFRCTTLWFNNFMHCAIFTTSVATIWPHTSLLNINDSILYILFPWLLFQWLLFPWLTYFITGNLYLPLPFTHFAQSLLYSPLATINLFFLVVGLILHCVCLFLFFFFKIPLMREIVWYLSFLVWLVLLSIIPSRSTHIVSDGMILSYLRLCNIPLCIRRIYVRCIYVCHRCVIHVTYI